MNTDMFKKGVDQIKKGLNDAKDVISKVKEELENCGYTFSYTKAND